MSCRIFFEGLPTGDRVSERAGLIDSAHPSAECEAESVSEHSTGVIGNEEYLHRYVFSPLHLHEGKVVAALFTDAKDKGLSCERSQSSTPSAELHARGRAQVDSFNGNRRPNQSERSYVGTVTAQVLDVRKISLGDSRTYGVYDTGLPNNPAHVDVFEISSVVKSGLKSEQKLVRLALAEAFTDEPSEP